SRTDLKKPTPYNTYIIPALPPSPICSPGKEALMAVLEPASVEYLYFVSKNDGSHYFSKTLREHNQAVRTYQKRNRPNPKQ
ncbi:MAG: BCR, YceG family protein, partial [Desulfobacterales bacterium]|nr:BCR, YceG family protein [Desulfobacterales bacterium]